MKKNLLVIIIAIIVIAILIFVFYSFRGGGEGGKLLDTGGKDQSLNKVLKSGKLVVGTFPEFSPMTFKDDEGKNIGYDIDLINDIAGRLGVEVEFKEMIFPSLFDAVKAEEVDIAISSITITPERSKTVLFSIPYFTSGQTIILREEYGAITRPEDFTGKKIGAIRNTTCEAAVKDYTEPPHEEFISFETLNDEIEALKKGEIDAVVHDYCVAAYIVNLDSEIKLVGDPFTQEYYGMMSNIKSEALIEKLNELLREVKREGGLKTLDAKWFGE